MAPELWTTVLKPGAYDYIINCIGILKSSVNEDDTESIGRAIRVNALFPHEVAAIASQSRILHVSTDGVFSGNLQRPYVENDSTDCADAYGKTKALGESPASNVINIRASIIGRDPGGKGLVELILRSTEGSDVTGFDDQQWNGVTTEQFAELCCRIIESGNFDRIRDESGLHHFCPNPPTTKYDLLCHIREKACRNITVRRGYSGARNARILASIYSSLRDVYPEHHTWDALIQEVLAGEISEPRG